MRGNKRVSYGSNKDEYVVIESLSDEIRFAQCMKLYKSFDTIEKLEKSLKTKTLNKIKQIY
jgi:hypothetical protein